MYRRTLLASALVLFLIATACTPAAPPTPMVKSTEPPPTATEAATATREPTVSNTPVPTSTPTETPIPTATYTPTPAPTNTRAATPTPSVTPTPATATSVVFTDDFGAKCGLLVSENENRKYGCENGRYTMMHKVDNYSGWVWYGDTFTDAVVEADFHALGGDSMAYGLLFRRSATGAYVFLIGSDGRYSLLVNAGQKWTTLAPWTDSNAFNPGAVNRVRAILQGNQIGLYLNDKPLDMVEDSTSKTGTVGVMFVNDKPNDKIGIDNYTVSKINRPVPMPPSKEKPPAPTPMPEIPAGMGGLLVVNYYGREINFDIGGKLYKVPPNGSTSIFLPPGNYAYSADIPGLGRAGGKVDIVAGEFATLSWADR